MPNSDVGSLSGFCLAVVYVYPKNHRVMLTCFVTLHVCMCQGYTKVMDVGNFLEERVVKLM